MAADPATWGSVLVRLPNWVGDVVMATPALAALRAGLPRTRILAALRASVAPLIRGLPLVDDVLEISRSEESGWSGLTRQARRWAALRPDAAISFTNSFGSALPLALARIKRRIGYGGDGRSWLLTDAVATLREGPDRRPMPMPEFYQRILDAVGIPSVGPGYSVMCSAADRQEGRRTLAAAGWNGSDRLLGLNAGARFGSSKLWSAERFGALGGELWRRHGLRPVAFGGPGEAELGERILSASGGVALPAFRDVVGLRTLTGQLSHLSLLITNDTGPRHLGVALGLPTVAIFGSTDRRWTDWNLERSAIVFEEVPCGPCHLPRCPFDQRCLERVSVARVLAAAESLMPL